MMECFCENSERPLAISYFRKNTQSQMSDRVLNTPLKYLSNWVSHACRDLPKVYQTLLGPLHLQCGYKKINSEH